jgi:hypothetical protein
MPVRVSFGIFCPGCYGNASAQVGSPITDNLDDYKATITSLEVENYNPASQYTFRDMSGLAGSVAITLPTSSSKLSGGVIAGIVVGGLVAVIIIIGVGVYLHRTMKAKKSHDKAHYAQDVRGARTKFTEGQNRNGIATMEKPVTRALRYPEEREAGGRLGELSLGEPGRG